MWSNSHASLIVPSWKSLYAFVCFSLTLNMYKVTGQFPWSSLKETDRGMSAELNVRVCVCVFVAPCLCWLENTDFVTLSARQTVTSAHVQHKQDIQYDHREIHWQRFTNMHTAAKGSSFTSANVLRLQFPLGMTSHTLKWEGVWRELGCLARSASFAVREESGHSLKSALSVQSEASCYY